MPKPLKPYTITYMRQELKRLSERRLKDDKRMKELRARCPHDWQYLPDPSGNIPVWIMFYF